MLSCHLVEQSCEYELEAARSILIHLQVSALLLLLSLPSYTRMITLYCSEIWQCYIEI